MICGSLHGRHLAAVIGAAPAFIGTHLAMLVLETVAFRGAGVADGCAESTDLSLELAVSGHVLRSHGANIGTVPQ